MNQTSLAILAAGFAVVAVAGVFLAVAGIIGVENKPVRRRSRMQRKLRAVLGANGPAAGAANGGAGGARWWVQRRAKVIAAGVVAVGVWVVTAWPMAGLLAGAGVLGLSWMLNPGAEHARAIDKLEALEEWVRRLADIHTVGISLEQAVVSSLKTVPAPVESEVRLLVARLGAGWPPTQAYRAFADDLNDATADMVVALMLLHATDRGAGLGRALTDLARSVSEEVLMRRKVEADRAKPRANARWITAFCLIVFGLSFFSGSYAAPYHTWYGQLVMAAFAAGFIALLVWMRRMANLTPTPRFLSAADRTGAPAPAPARAPAQAQAAASSVSEGVSGDRRGSGAAGRRRGRRRSGDGGGRPVPRPPRRRRRPGPHGRRPPRHHRPRHETAAGVSVLDRIGAKALAQFGEQALRIPRRELDILRESPARFVGRKVALALYGLALPTIAVALLALAGVQVPFAIPGFAALVAAGCSGSCRTSTSAAAPRKRGSSSASRWRPTSNSSPWNARPTPAPPRL
ncbi:type II secretion system F family protein [Streptacidiphilus monticola]